MKIVIIESLENELEKQNKELALLKSGKATLKKEHVLKLTPGAFNSVFSPERLRLLRTIKDKNPESIYQLAQILNRHYEAVYTDLKYLEGFKIVQLKKEDNRVKPILLEDIKVPVLV